LHLRCRPGGDRLRGKYLVTIVQLPTDCHTPGYFLGKPDNGAPISAASDVGFSLPGLGVFVGSQFDVGQGNLGSAIGPDQQVHHRHPDRRADRNGRMLAPIMPYHAFANLTPQDALAIVAFLRSIPPVQHKVPGPFGPTETPARSS
jgi:hypothetical protein